MPELEHIGPSVQELLDEVRKGEWVVTRYIVSRPYGGPEEGGWWYDWYELDEEFESTGPLAWQDAINLRDELNKPLEPETRFSVVGGPDRRWVLERERGDSVSTERPRYE